MYRKFESHQRLSHEVADHVKMLIRDGQLKSGDKLPSEMELTQLFGVSRPTIREAIHTLVSQNILLVLRGRGTFVSDNPGITADPLGLDLLSDAGLGCALVQARFVLEPGVAKLAAENADKEDLEKIYTYLHEMEHIVEEQKVSMSVELEFHHSIAQASKNPVIMRIIPIIMDSIFRVYKDTHLTLTDHKRALDEHREIAEAISNHDGDEAERAMRHHLENSRLRSLAKQEMAAKKKEHQA